MTLLLTLPPLVLVLEPFSLRDDRLAGSSRSHSVEMLMSIINLSVRALFAFTLR
jgi:hypothetical protein